ncbi:MAG: hypothetical protein LLG08_00650 [Actinomycetia bacterium]|nr:hypothetical protein [Actinomycetes bacterium]
MAECAFHPGVDTNVRCTECERPICPKDMVETPVGYKCRECARPVKAATQLVKPRQWAIGAIVGLVAGLGGGILLGRVFFIGFWIAYLLFGLLVGEVVRRGTGGHRTQGVATLAAVCALLGALAGGFSIFGLALGTGAAAVYVMSNRW